MSSGFNIGTKSSFYARHLHITGIEPRMDVMPEDVAEDVAALNGFDLPDLQFTPETVLNRERTHDAPDKFVPQLMQWIRNTCDELLQGHSGVLGAVAMALLIIIPMTTLRQKELDSDTVRVKGGDKVILHIERKGVVTQAVPGQRLENGDRVRIEILAASPRVVFQFVTNAERQVLTPLKDVLHDRLLLAAGDRGVFPGSIELVGENEGEVLNIMVCDRSLNLGFIPDFINEYAGKGDLPAPNGCLLKAIELR